MKMTNDVLDSFIQEVRDTLRQYQWAERGLEASGPYQFKFDADSKQLIIDFGNSDDRRVFELNDPNSIDTAIRQISEYARGERIIYEKAPPYHILNSDDLERSDFDTLIIELSSHFSDRLNRQHKAMMERLDRKYMKTAKKSKRKR